MLTDQEVRDIQAERQKYEDARAAIVGALRIVQQQRRWVSDDSVRDLARLLGLDPAEVDTVATFYSLIYRQPVGRHVILICDSVSCWIMGYNPLREALERQLGIGMGETTADDRFTLLPSACLGACDLAPAMMVDEDLHVQLTVERIAEILAQYP
ncbi:MAG: NADH-quinone oxidoreductase subunit NuoE [Armatimonadota bacterium]